MFKLGGAEILVILLVILVFVRPRDLPGFIRKIGELFRQLRNFKDNITDSLSEMEREIKAPISLDDPASSRRPASGRLEAGTNQPPPGAMEVKEPDSSPPAARQETAEP